MTHYHLSVIDHDPPRRRRFRWGRWLMLSAVGLLAVPAALLAGPSQDWDGWRLTPRTPGTPFVDALAVGREADGVLYACRGLVNQDMHVGRIRADFGGCHIGFAGKEMEVTVAEVLSLSWRGSDVGLASALPGGSERVAGAEVPFATARLYPCRASYMGGVHLGQARSGEKGCAFGFGGKRIVATTYEVLQDAPWLSWSQATSRTLPETAVAGGSEGNEPFYVCRVADRDGLHPGKVKKGPVGCSVASQGKEIIADRFEVLAPRWVAGHAGTVPVGAVLAGRENGDGQFVCRALSRDTVQVGKVNEALGGCHVGMQGREVVIADYEVLTQ